MEWGGPPMYIPMGTELGNLSHGPKEVGANITSYAEVNVKPHTPQHRERWHIPEQRVCTACTCLKGLGLLWVLEAQFQSSCIYM